MPSNKDTGLQSHKTQVQALPPAEGERRAMRGYMGQYDRAGAAIYAELEHGQLQWIGVADRNAGIADDLVLGFDGLVIGHQFKTSRFPGTFTVETLLTGANGLLKPLVKAWQSLSRSAPESKIEIRLVVNDYPSNHDKPGKAAPAHSAAFLEEFEQSPDRPLQAWQTSNWRRLIKMLQEESGLEEADFEQFLHALRVLHGVAANFIQLHKLSEEQARLATEIAEVLPKLVTDARDKDRWSREELLKELGWRDPAKTRHQHRFPVGAYAQRNRDTEIALLHVLHNVDQGYVSLVGPPGSGKSTLLQMALATESNIRLVRYLAFMPGTAQGVGRGEADNFLEDVITQLRNGGLFGLRLRDSTQNERRAQFGTQLKQAGERYERDGVRTIIVVDGLDHVPREEQPTHSLLGELPLPAAVPKGVMFVLGTQRLALAHLKPAVQEQAAQSNRHVEMRPLGREAVTRMADALGLDSTISRQRLYELGHGYPLAIRYLIQALLSADKTMCSHVLAGGMEFDGDIESVYASAWMEIAHDPDAMQVLGFIARAEAPMPLPLLATIVEEQAIERALLTARHLLKKSPHGWGIFHNSFRLFVLSKPRIRLGSIDLEYPQRVYRELAQLSRGAPANSPQRWLELRYRARADDRDDVLALATPERFRRQLAEGRSVTEIQSDIRLALLAARTTLDATIVTRLLLSDDEVSRRVAALENADQVPLAMLAVGDIEAACAFVQDFPNMGYEVVDALLERGEFDRAKELFEHLEPLSQLHTNRFQNYGQDHNLQEFVKWTRRVFHFRDFEQILQSIDHLAVEGIQQTPGATSEETATSVRKRLRLEVAEAILGQQSCADVREVCEKLGIEQAFLSALMVRAGFDARDRGENAHALALFMAAKDLPGFDNVPNGLRRSFALLAVINGHREVAEDLFSKLVVPAISMIDKEPHSGATEDLVHAVLEHAHLCAMLVKPLPAVAPSKYVIFQPLQAHASEIGTLLGRAMMDPLTIAAGHIQRVCRSAMGYVLRLRANGGGDFDLMFQAVRTAPVLAQSLINLGALCGESEYRAVLNEIDKAISTSTPKSTMLLRRELAVATYQADGDRVNAAARLEPLVDELLESTPSEHLNGLSDLVIAFAAIGDVERARNLLATIPDHCLGYALAARKDPQYSMWRDILVLANADAPEQRGERISLLMRQIDGMKETEGASAAHRLTMTLIDEAMQINARYGFDVSQILTDWQLIAWPNRVDALMIGLLRRRPELLFACVAIWSKLCLPFYMEPHYRDPTHVGDFIDVAADVAGQKQIAELVLMLQTAIEVDSRAHERLTLLNRLRVAAARHEYTDRHLKDAVDRWSLEAPEPRHSSTPQKYDDAANLNELQQSFEADGKKLEYNAPSRFCELAPLAPLEQVRQMYERWDSLQSDTRSRFMVVERSVSSGDTNYAKKLVHEYKINDGERNYWNQWMGGGKFRYFYARKLLEGAAVHQTAYENLVDSVIAREENAHFILMDIDSILPVITASPDWPAIWSDVTEQMTSTREHQLGAPFTVIQKPLSDVELLVELLYFALRLPITQVQRHARDCALQLADQAGDGKEAFELTIRRLLSGDLDEPLQALQILLLLGHDRFSQPLGIVVADLVNHSDVAIAEAAELLARRWNIQVSTDVQPLPLFYQLELDNTNTPEADAALLDKETGAMRVETDVGWTRLLRPISRALADAADCDEVKIRRRAAMFIQQWGGLDAFGRPANERLQAQLRMLSMQITYHKPHAWIGVLALRHVAGELRRAELLSPKDIPSVLERLNAPLPPRAVTSVQVRPQGISRPLEVRNAPWEEKEKLWADQVGNDVAPWTDGANEFVVAEVSRFKIFKVRQAEYQLHRIRAPRLQAEGDEFWDWYRELPAAVWLGQVVPFDRELAPTLIRRLVSSLGMEDEAYPIALCPNWLRRLRWHAHEADPSIYVDSNSTTVARIALWRDAGPVDIESESIWGAGTYVALTVTGLQQFIAVQADSPIHAFARREVRRFREEGTEIVKTARSNYRS